MYWEYLGYGEIFLWNRFQVPDTAIVDYIPKPDEFQGKDFMDPADDKTSEGTKEPIKEETT